jgi:sulfatase modifying factor 1
MSIEGVRFGATRADVEKVWGPASSRDDEWLRYQNGPTVKAVAMGPARGLLFDFGPWAHPWAAKHADSPISILGKTCEEAAKALEFTSAVGSYTTCKHYERDSMVDVTLMCSDTVSSVAVMWLQFDPIPADKPLPPDECSGSGSPKPAEAPACKRNCGENETFDSATGCCKPTPPNAAPVVYADPPVNVVEVRVEGATFRMGDGGKQVTVSPFFLDDIEVTVRAYAACVEAGTCSAPNAGKFCNWGQSDRGNHPINCVDWNQAVNYCKWKKKRLPTEEEWEWAASNGHRGTRYPWGNDPAGNRSCWNGAGNDKGAGQRKSTCVVGSHPRANNAQRIKDLAGNVWEWTSSKYRPAEEHVVIRGASWMDDLADGHTAYRLRNIPTERYGNIGFRCARTP